MGFIKKNGKVIFIRNKGEHSANTKHVNRIAAEHGIHADKVRETADWRGIKLNKKMDADSLGELEFKVHQKYGK